MTQTLEQLDFLFREHFWAFAAPFIFVIGTCMGSFLNVCFYRIPLGISLLHPPSSCPKCGYRIPSYENLPIIGWLILGGKCHNCSVEIPVRYLLFEVFTGCIFVFSAFRIHSLSGGLTELIFALAIVSWFIPIIAIDARHKRIPRLLTTSGIIFFLIWNSCFPFTFKDGWVGDLAREFMQEALVKEFPNTTLSLPWQALLYSFFGLACGWALLVVCSVIGRMATGRRKTKLDPECLISFDKESFTIEGDEPATWEELLQEKSDHMNFDISGGSVLCQEQEEQELPATRIKVTRQFLSFGKGQKINRQTITNGSFKCSQVILPHDVIGRGDVTLLAFCGLLLGPLSCFIILASAIFFASTYALITRFLLRIKNSELPFGPFIAFAALIVLFFPRECHNLSAELIELWRNNFA